MPDAVGTSTPLQVAINIAKVCTGAGLLGLPHAFSQSGIAVGTAGMVLVVYLNVVSCRLLLRCKSALAASLWAPAVPSASAAIGFGGGLHTTAHSAPAMSPVEHHPDTVLPEHHGATPAELRRLNTFAALARVALGPSGPNMVDYSIILTLWGVVAVYLITIGSLFHQVFPVLSSTWFTLMSSALLLPFAFGVDLAFLSWVSLAGVLCYILAYVAIFWYGAVTYSLTITHDMIAVTNLTDVMEFLGVAVFTLGIPLLVFSLQESMAQPKLFLRTLEVTLGFVALAYVAIGVLGYALFASYPGGVSSLIISHLPAGSWAAGAVKVVLALTLLLSAPLSLVPTLDMLRTIMFPVGAPLISGPTSTALPDKAFKAVPPTPFHVPAAGAGDNSSTCSSPVNAACTPTMTAVKFSDTTISSSYGGSRSTGNLKQPNGQPVPSSSSLLPDDDDDDDTSDSDRPLVATRAAVAAAAAAGGSPVAAVAPVVYHSTADMSGTASPVEGPGAPPPLTLMDASPPLSSMSSPSPPSASSPLSPVTDPAYTITMHPSSILHPAAPSAFEEEFNAQLQPLVRAGDLPSPSSAASPGTVVSASSEPAQFRVVRVAAMALITCVAIFVPCFSVVISLIGCFTLSLLSFVLPPLFYLHFARAHRLPAGWAPVAGCYALIAFGCLVFVVGSGVIVVSGKCS